MTRSIAALLVSVCFGMMAGSAQAQAPAKKAGKKSSAPVAPTLNPPAPSAVPIAPGPGSSTGPSSTGPSSTSSAPQLFPLPVVPPAPPAKHGFSFQNLRLDPRNMQRNAGENPLVGEPLGLAPGFLSINLPEKITPLAVGAELGILTGKLLLIQSLCELGRCRVYTGPGDLSDSWVEELSEHPLKDR